MMPVPSEPDVQQEVSLPNTGEESEQAIQQRSREQIARDLSALWNDFNAANGSFADDYVTL